MNIGNKILISTVCVAGFAGSVQAQGVLGAVSSDKGAAFQYFFNTGEPGVANFRFEPMGGKTVTGKPLSAVEVRRTRQTLGDGTHIDKVEKDKYYRDFEGRTRIDREGGGIMVSDPSTGTTRDVVSGRSRVMAARSGTFTSAVGVGGAPPPDIQLHKQMIEKATAEAGATSVAHGVFSTTTDIAPRTLAATVPDKGVTEQLGDQVINGVVAHGTRTTITIPLGQIGNDKEIKVVSERWFSEDLGLLIKSSNNDPRFGETTFELAEIIQGAQDPTLFELPKHE